MDFSSILAELYLIHKLVDEKNSAAVIGVDILSNRTAGNGFGEKSGTGIAHHDQNSTLFIATYQAFHGLCRIFLRTVNHGVGKSFLQCQYNEFFLAVPV